jgi:hypothetical protein
VGDVGADLAGRAVDQLLELGQERIDAAGTAGAGKRVGAGIADGDIGGHGLGVAADQLRRGPGAAGQVEGFENLHDLPGRLGQRSLRVGGFSAGTGSQPHRRGRLHWWAGAQLGLSVATHLEFSWPPAKTVVATYRESLLAALRPIVP